MASALQRTELDDLAFTQVIVPGVARAAVLGVAVRVPGTWAVHVGASGHTGRGGAGERTLFDLASVSKPFLAAAYARLLAGGRVGAGPLVSWLPELSGTWAAETTLEALLSHRAGLAPHARLFAPLAERRAFDRVAALRAAANASEHPRARADEQPFAPRYSDLGYLLAAAALSRVHGGSLDQLVEELVAAPLGVGARSARLWLARDENFVERVAPTEHVTFRGGELRGVVHDENAWAFAGHGFAGHAGLFGTVHDVLGFGMALIDALAGRREDWLDRATVAALVAERPGGSLRLGFDGKSAEGSSAGPSASSHTFGHLGFTGTSFWCDPKAEVVTVLLSNRVCPTRENNAIRSCRPVVHEALFRFAKDRASGPGLGTHAVKGLGGSDQP